MLKPYALFLSLMSAFLLISPANAEIFSPPEVQDAHLLKKDSGRARIGLAYAADQHLFFEPADFNRDLVKIPEVSVYLGLGERVEAQAHYEYLRLKEKGQRARWGSGDLTLGFKIALTNESRRFPATALRIATKLPNADNEEHFGTDEADVFLDFLAARRILHLSAYLNLGLAILGNSEITGEGQDDLLSYAAGIRAPLHPMIDLLISANGLALGKEINDRGKLGTALQIYWKRWIWDIGGSVGYVDNSEDWGVHTGLTFLFDWSG